MSFMEKVAATLATKYGVVKSGKHEGCQIAMGNPPDQKVTTSYAFSQIIFVDGNEEKGRYDIKTLRMKKTGHNDQGVQMTIFFNAKEACNVDILLRQEDKFWVKILKTFMGQKGGASTTVQEQQEMKFHNMVVFFKNNFACMTKDDIDFFEAYFMENDVLDDVCKKLIKVYRETVNKDGQ